MLSEEDLGGTGVRFSAEALLQSLVAAAGAAGPPAVVDALQRRLAEASALQARFCSLLRAHETTGLPPAVGGRAATPPGRGVGPAEARLQAPLRD